MALRSRAWLLWVVGVSGLLPGCIHQAVANMTGTILHRASPAVEQQDDYAFVGAAMPTGIVQMDGLLEIVPDNETLLLDSAQGYVAYTFGYIEDQAEAAEDRGDLEEYERQRARARGMYLRAKERAMHWLRLKDPGLDRAIAAGPDAFERHLREEFLYAKDAPGLFWAGFAWGLAINSALEDATLLADLPITRLLVERSVQLDEGYYHYSGLAFLGFADAIVAESIGGHPERGREFFERALEKTHRSVFFVQFLYARSYAIQTQNRELYESLLQEVRDGQARNPNLRLLNTIAKRRADRWLARAGQYF